MDRIAEFLIERETITGKEFMQIFRQVTGRNTAQQADDRSRAVAETGYTGNPASSESGYSGNNMAPGSGWNNQ